MQCLRLVLEFLVEDEFPQPASATLELDDVVRQFLDGPDLLFKVVSLQEVAELRIVVTRSNGVNLQQIRIHRLLELQRRSHGLQGRSPLVLGWFRHGLQQDATSTHVLVLHQPLGVLTLLVGSLLEELVQSGESNVVPVEVVSHGHVDVAGVEFHVDLAIDVALTFIVVVLPGKGAVRSDRGSR